MTNSKHTLKKWMIAGFSFATMLGASTVGLTAEAATTSGQASEVHAVHRVWLRSHSNFGHDGIVREQAGTTFTVLSGSNSHWWHVRDSHGRVGYITTKQYWVQNGGNGTAAAATNGQASEVHAVRRVWLRSHPQFGRNGIIREPAGTTFTVLTGGNSKWWHVRDSHGRVGYITTKGYWVDKGGNGTTSAKSAVRVRSTAGSTSSSTYSTSASLPPGVRYDSSITPVAGLHATWQQKFDAVLSVAKSKLGTPYRWGHNEDRGQYGFDCSNFTEYVYHHALGYRFSGASRTQARSVGRTVPRRDMRPGDLLIFNNGGHVGIYIGHNEMIEEGGGLGRVGYLSVGPHSYWGRHLTAVKRMF